MKHDDLVALVKDSGDYVDDIKFTPDREFIGLVYVKNYKYQNECQWHFPVAICSEE